VFFWAVNTEIDEYQQCRKGCEGGHKVCQVLWSVVRSDGTLHRTVGLTSDVIQAGDDNAILFQFLSTLPNLQSLKYSQRRAYLQLSSDLQPLFASVQHAPLLEFVLDSGYYSVIEGSLVTGLTGLEKLSISWFMDDKLGEPGSSLTHLCELVRPSLSTLVSLRLDNEPEHQGADLDLQLLKPAGTTLRTFEYTLQSGDTGILDTISEIFPHLTKLAITWSNLFIPHSPEWTVRFQSLFLCEQC